MIVSRKSAVNIVLGRHTACSLEEKLRWLDGKTSLRVHPSCLHSAGAAVDNVDKATPNIHHVITFQTCGLVLSPADKDHKFQNFKPICFLEGMMKKSLKYSRFSYKPN